MRAFLQLFGQLLGLCAMVVSKPVFDVLSGHPEYLVVNRIGPVELYVWTAGISLGLPLALTAMTRGLGLAGARPRMLAQSLLVAALAGVFVLQLAKRSGLPPLACVLLALLVAAGGSVAYARKPAVSQYLSLVSPVGLLFPILFLASSEIRNVFWPDSPAEQGRGASADSVESRPPIVMLVFDEFSLVDLLDANGEVDGRRFPGFASLAAGSTWYANASTVHYSTTGALPAILTGRRAVEGALPRHHDYPDNLFSLLQGHYALNVVEPVTALLRESGSSSTESGSGWLRGGPLRVLSEDMVVVFLHFTLPEPYARVLPSIDATWGGFVERSAEESNVEDVANAALPTLGSDAEKAQARKVQTDNVLEHMWSDRRGLVRSFVSSIDAEPPETLHFLHILLPHRPSRYLPSGRAYRGDSVVGVHEGEGDKQWVGPQFLVDRLHQAHLLQIGFVDTLVGQTIGRMKEAGIYDDSLLIVLADHGLSFQAGVSNRRPGPENAGAIAFVPLFVKYPNQREGLRDDTNVETIDVLPTIVDVLGAETSWEFDGRSLIDPQARVRPTKRLASVDDDVLEYSEREYLEVRREALESRRRKFSLDDPRSDLFSYGPGLDLIGRPVAELGKPANCVASSAQLEQLRQVNLRSGQLQVHIDGTVRCRGVDPTSLYVVVSVGGVVAGVTQPYPFRSKTAFDLILSEKVLRHGTNDIRMFLVPAGS